MRRTVLFALLLAAVLFIGMAGMPQTAKAWGPCDGPYGGYAGCNYYGGYSGYSYGYGCSYGCGYYGYYQPMYSGYTYNRVCYYGAYGRLYCSYVRVPAYPVSGYYGYMGYGYGW